MKPSKKSKRKLAQRVKDYDDTMRSVRAKKAKMFNKPGSMKKVH